MSRIITKQELDQLKTLFSDKAYFLHSSYGDENIDKMMSLDDIYTVLDEFFKVDNGFKLDIYKLP